MFIKEVQHTIQRTEVNNTSNQSFAGFKEYFGMYVQALEMSKGLKVSIFTHLSLFFQCIFKPLKQFYSYTTKISGCYSIINGHFKDESLKKIIIYRLFKIPIFVKSPKLTKEDIKELLK